MLRRKFLSTTAIAAAGLVAACTTSTVNGVTTVTLNTAQVNSWAQAFLNGAQLVANLPGIMGTPLGLTIAGIAPVISADVSAFNTATGGSLVLTYDRTSPVKAVDSLLADGHTLLTDALTAIPQVPATIAADAQTYLQALKTIVSLFEAALGGTTAAAVAKAPMSEGAALKALGVH